MKRVFILSLIMCVIAACGLSEANESPDVAKIFSKKLNLESQKQKASYAIGYNMGKSLRPISSEIDLFIVLQGLVDGEGGDEKAQLDLEEIQKVLMEFQGAMRQKIKEKKMKEGEKNKVEGEKFLAENAKKEGVKVTESGLQYTIIKEGSGPHPKATDVVNVHYKGMFLDGKEFDSSYSRGKPATFPLNRVIKGWTEGLQLMKVGAKWKFFIPSEIAYGERGKGEIGPNAALIFEVELLGIDIPKEAPAQEREKE
jgi:FKBP-type peptidyl-prolyl cis-trans isomerase FkpA